VIPDDFWTLVQVITPPEVSEEVLEEFKQELEGLVSRYPPVSGKLSPLSFVHPGA
jgi:hypothetical protein